MHVECPTLAARPPRGIGSALGPTRRLRIPTMRDGARVAPERPATERPATSLDDLACVARGALPLALVHASLYAMQLTDMCMVGLYLGTYPLTVIPRRSAPRSTGPRG